MKERILKALKELCEGKNEPLKNILISEGISPKQLANAPLLLEKILYHYSDFNISTIDSFFQRIVRTFNKELNISQDFNIEINTDEATDFAVDRFLQNSNEQPEIHKILIAFIHEKILNGKSWNIKGDLNRIAREVLKDDALILGETDIPLIFDFIKELKKIMHDFEEKMDAIASKLLNGIKELGLEIDDFKYGKAGAFSFIMKSLKSNRDYEPGSRFLSVLESDFEWYKKNDPNLRLIEEALDTFLRSGSLELFEIYESGFRKYATAKEILKNIYTFSVYEELKKMFDDYRSDKNVLLVSDFTRLLAKHLRNEEVSYVYSRIGSRFDHFLIDEFQDTSLLQWTGIKTLVENSVSQGNICLVVGDPKQAIYRWRGGEIELIEKQLSETDFPAYAEKFNLSSNFRSYNAIVAFNNQFFNKVSKEFTGDTDEYILLNQIFKESAQQARKDFPSSGYVEINYIAKPEQVRESFLIPAREKLLEQIKQCIQDGFSLKDMTILVRDRKDTIVTANLLQTENIPFVSYDSLQLQHSPAVRLLLSLLCWINDHSDALALTESTFLYLQYFAFPESSISENLGKINDAGRNSLPESLIQKWDKLQKLPLYELVEELILILEINDPDAYLQRFQDAVLEYVQTETGSIPGFLDWWEKGNFSVVLPESQDAIQIMTIHKSKGLEFPVVIIPFADWEFMAGRPGLLWLKPDSEPLNTFPALPVNFGSGLKNTIFESEYYKEEALTVIDNLNLLYVAFTRAVVRLYVNTQIAKNIPKNGIKNIYQLINQVLPPNPDDPFQTIFGEKSGFEGTKHKTGSNIAYVVMNEYIVNSRT